MPGAPELMPVPDRDRVAPEFGSVIVPVLLPTAVGVNVTVPEHDADAASVPGVQPFVAREKSPEIVRAAMVTLEAPKLVSVHDWLALVVETV
jgi:hypothetical protein